MFLTLKTLDQNTFQVEVDGSESVLGLKCLIEARMGKENIYKVIYQGKLLKDGCLLSDYNIEPKKHLVLMITKPQNTESAEAGSSSMLENGASAAVGGRLKEDGDAENNDRADIPMTERKFKLLVFSLVLLNHKFHAVNKLMSRFPLPDQVLEFMMTGSPPQGGENPLDFLRSNQEFKIFRLLVKRRPDSLSSLLVVFGKKNAHLLDLINTNKWTFLKMINEPETEHIIPKKYMHCK